MSGEVPTRGDSSSSNQGYVRTRYGDYGSFQIAPQQQDIGSTRRPRLRRTPSPIYPLFGILLVSVCVYLVADKSEFRIQKPLVGLSSEQLVEDSAWRGVQGDESVDGTEGLKLFVRVFNSYTNDSPIELYPWEHTAEPYRPSTMEVLDEMGETSKVIYRWEVDGHLQGYGTAVEVMFLDVGFHDCEITAYDLQEEDRWGAGPPASSGGLGLEEELGESGSGGGSWRKRGSLKFDVMVKYVRREIRALRDQDREAFFNTVSVMQRVPSAVGRAVYGDFYRSKDYFARKHIYYGGWKDCDHWHESPGFVTSHMALTMEFEKALQAVNPSVSAPYWDFTIESAEYGLRDWRDSGVFSDDWFGSAIAENTLHIPLRGRFAYVPVMTNAREYSATYNSYGQLKAAWNSDPTPFVTRHDRVYGYYNVQKPSGCETYYNVSQNFDWMSLSYALNGDAHGHIHEFMGGSWNHHNQAYRQEQTINYMIYSHPIEGLSKDLWKVDILTCPDHCSGDTPWKSCRCTCDMDAIGDTSPYDVLKTSGVLKKVELRDAEGNIVIPFNSDENPTTLPGLTEEESQEVFRSLLGVLCSPGHIGTMFQATSTDDITFWVLHPTVDRLWHLKRLTPGGYTEGWEVTGTCYGQDPDQLQPFGYDLFNGVGGLLEVVEGRGGGATVPATVDSTGNKKVEGAKKYLTNGDLYELMHPGKEHLPYVYDNFRWTHCEAMGLFIDGSPGMQ